MVSSGGGEELFDGCPMDVTCDNESGQWKVAVGLGDSPKLRKELAKFCGLRGLNIWKQTQVLS